MDISKAILLGYVGKDPVLFLSNAGVPVVSLSLATSSFDKNKQKITTWHKLVFFGSQADVVEKTVKKGDKLFVEGFLANIPYTNKEGQLRDGWQIKVSSYELISSKGGDFSNSAKAPSMNYVKDDEALF